MSHNIHSCRYECDTQSVKRKSPLCCNPLFYLVYWFCIGVYRYRGGAYTRGLPPPPKLAGSILLGGVIRSHDQITFPHVDYIFLFLYNVLHMTDNKFKKMYSNNIRNKYEEFNYFQSLEDYRSAFQKFYDLNGYYPTSLDIDVCEYLPSSKTLQRRFKSLVALRNLLNLPQDQIDLRKSPQRILSALSGITRSYSSENDVYQELLKFYEPLNIHKQSPINDNTQQRCDFVLFENNERKFFVDVTFPTTIHSVKGCINSKLRRYKKSLPDKDTYIVLMSDHTEEDINRVLKWKKLPIPSNVKIVSFEGFKKLLYNTNI